MRIDRAFLDLDELHQDPGSARRLLLVSSVSAGQGDRQAWLRAGEGLTRTLAVMGFTWGVCTSRLTRKRQRTRREEGRPRMADLGQIIRPAQREAAALPTDALRHEIEINLAVQDAAIRQFYGIRPMAGRSDALGPFLRCSDVDAAALDGLNQALVAQDRQGLVYRPARDAIGLRELALGRHRAARGQLAALDLSAQDGRQLEVDRHVGLMINARHTMIMPDQA
jgi:hypothetical protein